MLADNLKTLLATEYAFSIKAQLFHWNVEGPDFAQMHEFFGELYEEVYDGSIDKTAEYIRDRVHAGNCYVNRNMIGAVVGLQPFGGEGLSGTGPKAGGPHYLPRLCLERSLSINTTAAGGNASLLCLEE